MKTALASLASQYAEAVIDLAAASGGGIAERILSDLSTINQVVASTPDFSIVLDHPSVPGPEKKRLLMSAFQKVIDDLSWRLLQLLADRRRLALLPYIETSYGDLLKARKNLAVASLVSADPLPEATIDELKARLTAQLGKQIELNVKVDPTLIGGMILRVGDRVTDGSLKGRLEALSKSLLSV